MQNIQVHYAGIPQITTAIVFSFDARRQLGGSSTQLQVLPPKSYRLSCSPEFLNQISLPFIISCTTEPLTLTVNGTLSPGRHAFAIGVTVPTEAAPPDEDLFRFMVLDSEGSVVDANMEVPTLPIQYSLKVYSPLMAWTASHAGAESYITFGLRFKRNLSPTAEKQAARPRIAALLLEMPEGFEHLIRDIRDVRNLNNKFPLMPCQDDVCPWAHYDSTAMEGSYFNNGTVPVRDFRRLRIVRDETRTVPADSFRWAFPVRVPAVVPRENFWHLSLCSDPECRIANGAGVVVSFVLVGFNHGQVSTAPPFDPNPPTSQAPWRPSGVAAAGAFWLVAALRALIL